MRVGSASTVTHDVSRAVSVTLASITGEDVDDQLVPTSHAVASSPSADTAALLHSLSMTFSPTVGGWHDLNWRYTVVEDSEAFLETDRAFATFTDVGTIVRDLLQRTAEQLPDDQVVREFGYVVDYYQALLTCWTYSQTDAAVRPAVDRGLAYLVADSLRGRLPQTRPAGALIAFSQGTTRFQFSDPGKVTTASVDADAWCELAKPFLASDACFAAYLAQGFGYSHYPERQPEIRSYPTEELAF